MSLILKKIFYIVLFFIISVSGILFFLNRNTDKKHLLINNKCDRCNIILIDIDILRADALPCYGYNRNTAPNICALAEKSILFKDNYSVSNWTLPDMFSTITSLYPTYHGEKNVYTDMLSNKIKTFPEQLKENGYYTVFSNPLEDQLSYENGGLRGYDLVTVDPIEVIMEKVSKQTKPWFILYYKDDLHMPYLLNDNEQPIVDLPKPKNLPITGKGYSIIFNNYLKKNYKKVFTERAIKEFASIILAPSKNDDTETLALFYKIQVEKTEREFLFDAWTATYNSYLESFDKNSQSDSAYVRMLYDTKISSVDKDLEPLFAKLESEPYANNTITMIMSNHGEAFGEHGLFAHNSDYHSIVYYTPLIIHTPQLSGKVIEQTTSNIDIFPTLMELVGITKPDGLQGESLIPYIMNNKNNYERFVFGEINAGYLLQNKEWLYYMPYQATRSAESILHNKIDDPKEKINVIDKYPDLVKSLYEKTNDMRNYNEKVLENKPPVNFEELKISPEKLERLKKEGYF